MLVGLLFTVHGACIALLGQCFGRASVNYYVPGCCFGGVGAETSLRGVSLVVGTVRGWEVEGCWGVHGEAHGNAGFCARGTRAHVHNMREHVGSWAQ